MTQERPWTYYILLVSNPNLNDIINYCVGDLITQRYSLDGTKIVLKRSDINDGTTYFDNLTPYTHAEISVIMQTGEWTNLNY